MRFEWDEEKNEKNIRDHGIDFDNALYVFADPLLQEYFDKAHSDEEERYQVIGIAQSGELKPEPLMVVVTYPAMDSVRIISARYLEPWERRKYYG